MRPADQDIGTLTQSIFEGLAPSHDKPRREIRPPRREDPGAAGRMVAAAGSFSKLIGDLQRHSAARGQQGAKGSGCAEQRDCAGQRLGHLLHRRTRKLSSTRRARPPRRTCHRSRAPTSDSVPSSSGWGKGDRSAQPDPVPLLDEPSGPGTNAAQQTLPPSPVQNPTGSLTVGQRPGQLVNALNPEADQLHPRARSGEQRGRRSSQTVRP